MKNTIFTKTIAILIVVFAASLAASAQVQNFKVGDEVEVHTLGDKWVRGTVTDVNCITLGGQPSCKYTVRHNPYGAGSKPVQLDFYPKNIRGVSNESGGASVEEKPDSGAGLQLGNYVFYDSNLTALGEFTLDTTKTYHTTNVNSADHRGTYKIVGDELKFVTGPYSLADNLTCELVYGGEGTKYEGTVVAVRFVWDKGTDKQIISYYRYSGVKK
jgi:hypothetical protein